MSASNPNDPTADYRKYPKGPNFLLIVILASVSILVIVAIAIFVLKDRGQKLVPHGPNPTPNSLVRPLDPTANPPFAV